jgi:hypothetical protein
MRIRPDLAPNVFDLRCIGWQMRKMSRRASGWPAIQCAMSKPPGKSRGSSAAEMVNSLLTGFVKARAGRRTIPLQAVQETRR